MKRLLLVFTCLFLSIGFTFAQTQISGRVIDSENEPIMGASVLVKGTSAGSATDVDGRFTVSVPAGGKVFVVSSVGKLKREIPIKADLTIVLESNNQLETVVVVGYSERKLGTVTGSVSVVEGAAFQKRPIANMGDALQGQVAGLQVFTPSGEPSATVRMRLRGVSSINAGTEPLYILDGAPISSGAFTTLNPNDIESMTVLKDASSTAIYGARAANGVIVLTSKRGKKGEAPRVTISGVYGFSKMTGDKMDMMNAEQWLNFQEILTPSNITNPEFQAEKNFIISNGIGTDWADVFFGGTAPMSQLDISVVGGTENTNYYLSFGHYGADGIMDDSSLNRKTFRSNIETTVNKWFKVGANINLAYTKYGTAAFGTTSNSVYNKAYASRIYNPTQSYYEILTDDDGNFLGYGKRLDYFDKLGYYNPYYLSEIQPRVTDQIRLNASTYENINPIKGLNLRAAQAVEGYDSRTSSKAFPVGPFDGAGSASETFTRYYNFTFTNTADYKFDINKTHYFSALLGQESIITRNQSFAASVTKLTDSRLMLLSAAAAGNVNVPTHTMYDIIFNSYFAQASYNYKQRYFLDLTGRRDGSSLFGKNVRWGTFYSIGGLWDAKQESFLKDVNLINNLTLKASYGTTGNSDISPYLALGTVAASGSYNGESGVSLSTPGNPELSWETVKSGNIGITTRLADRVNVELEYYNRKTEDMLMSIPYSMTTGVSSGYGNISTMRNRGVDLTVGLDVLKLNDFNWFFSANVNYNKNKILALFDGLDEFVPSAAGYKYQVGKSYGEFFYAEWAGVDPQDGYNTWVDLNGNLTKTYSEEGLQKFLGKQRYAPWSGGFSTRFEWKGFYLGADFSWILDQYMINNERWFVENPTFASSSNQTTEMFTMWQKPGDVTNISTSSSPMQFDSHLLENASFLRMKNLMFSYSLPYKVLDKTKFVRGAKIYFTGRNLLTITEYKGYDPEVDSNIQLGNYPNTKQYSFGVELTF